MQKYLRIFCFLGEFFFVFVRLLSLRGQAGGREGRREGGGWIFPRETNSLTFLMDLVPFPLDFPQENVGYLKENVRYLGFPNQTTVFLAVWTDFVPFPTFPDENLRYLGCGCCCCCS